MILLMITGRQRLEKTAKITLVSQKKLADTVSKEVDNVVPGVENRVHEVILTEMFRVAKPRVEMAVRLITGPPGQTPNSIVQNLDQGSFSASAEITPLLTATSRTD